MKILILKFPRPPGVIVMPVIWCGWRKCARAWESSNRRPTICLPDVMSPMTTVTQYLQRKDMLTDIESLIHHFINVTRGPKMPVGEAYVSCEIPRGEQGYYLVSDGLGYSYRTRIRGPGFANVQVMPLMAVGETIADLITIIGSFDYILPDIDR